MMMMMMMMMMMYDDNCKIIMNKAKENGLAVVMAKHISP